jgi:hypothetical protein
VKSDQLIKRRAKSGLIAVNVDWQAAKEFVLKFINKEFTVTSFVPSKSQNTLGFRYPY